MSKPQLAYGWFDDVALATGLGLVLFGLVVIGVFETLIGSVHFNLHVDDVSVVVVHTSFTPQLRTYIIALGFIVLFVWGLFRVSRAIIT